MDQLREVSSGATSVLSRRGGWGKEEVYGQRYDEILLRERGGSITLTEFISSPSNQERPATRAAAVFEDRSGQHGRCFTLRTAILFVEKRSIFCPKFQPHKHSFLLSKDD